MHYYGMAIIRPGSTLDDVMAPFWEGLEVEPHWEVMDDRLVRLLMPIYGVDTVEDFVGFENELSLSARLTDSGKVETWTTRNPYAKWDWYRQKGRMGNALPRIDGLFADRARASEIAWKKFRDTDVFIPFDVFTAEGLREVRSRFDWDEPSVEQREWMVNLGQIINPSCDVVVVDCHI